MPVRGDRRTLCRLLDAGKQSASLPKMRDKGSSLGTAEPVHDEAVGEIESALHSLSRALRRRR